MFIRARYPAKWPANTVHFFIMSKCMLIETVWFVFICLKFVNLSPVNTSNSAKAHKLHKSKPIYNFSPFCDCNASDWNSNNANFCSDNNNFTLRHCLTCQIKNSILWWTSIRKYFYIMGSDSPSSGKKTNLQARGDEHGGPQKNFVWPAKHSGETSSYYFRLLFVSVDEQLFFIFNRFHSMTKKLCGPVTQW